MEGGFTYSPPDKGGTVANYGGCRALPIARGASTRMKPGGSSST
jgi:hypothetical protein